MSAHGGGETCVGASCERGAPRTPQRAPAGVLPLHRPSEADKLLRKGVNPSHRKAHAAAPGHPVFLVAGALQGEQARARVLRMAAGAAAGIRGAAAGAWGPQSHTQRRTALVRQPCWSARAKPVRPRRTGTALCYLVYVRRSSALFVETWEQ